MLEHGMCEFIKWWIFLLSGTVRFLNKFVCLTVGIKIYKIRFFIVIVPHVLIKRKDKIPLNNTTRYRKSCFFSSIVWRSITLTNFFSSPLLSGPEIYNIWDVSDICKKKLYPTGYMLHVVHNIISCGLRNN